jgi:hypothetical protein
MEPQRRKFTESEDNALRILVAEMGPHKWDTIALSMPGRSGRQCRDRYRNYLCPGITSDEWTPEEDNLLRQKFMELGTQWAKISKSFRGRTGTALKNRWNYYVSKTVKHRPVQQAVVKPIPSTPQPKTESEVPLVAEELPLEALFGRDTSRDKLELAMLEFGYLADSFSDSSQTDQTGLFF